MKPEDQLPFRRFQVLELAHRGLKPEQIAEVLGLSTTNVRKLRSDTLRIMGSRRWQEHLKKVNKIDANEALLPVLHDKEAPTLGALSGYRLTNDHKASLLSRNDVDVQYGSPAKRHADAASGSWVDNQRLVGALKRLGPRHREILAYFIQGLTAEQIAQEVSLSKSYVRGLCYQILSYTGAPNAMALLAAISQLNIQPEAMDETEEAANKVSGETKTVNERERQLPVLLREKHRFQPPTIDQARNALQTLQRLTHRQHEVIELYGEGLTASEISQRLGISCQTVADIRHDAMRRLGVKTVMELVGKVTRLSIEASFVAPHW